MKKNLLLATMLFTAFTVSAQEISLTQTVKGTIIDEKSGNILHNAKIVLEGPNSPAGDVSDSLGNFKLKNVPIGRQTIHVTLVGYEEAVIRNIEVTSSKEVVIEVRMKERIKKLDEVVIRAGKQKNRALNEAAVVSARQFSVEEAVRYAGTRNDPSRMAQNFAGVSG